MTGPTDYDTMCKLVQDCTLPAMFVDLDAFDWNAHRFIDIARRADKTIRIASKSLRVPALLRRFQELAGDIAQGVMCYSVAEAAFLAGEGFDDLLVAYPHVQPQDVHVAAKLNKDASITLMVDCAEHVDLLATYLEQSPAAELQVCIDVDASLKKFGQHLGAQRSPVRDIAALKTLLKKVQQSPRLTAVGAMTYEAQVAGLADSVPGQAIKNAIIRKIKDSSMSWLKQYRREIREAFEAEDIAMTLFNGGGSGSFSQTAEDQSLTEITVGSGLLQSHLFDHFEANSCEPALFFALPITRIPEPGLVTCHSGGFIASGSPGLDRQPSVHQPAGVRVESREGFGEVQTPLRIPDSIRNKLHIGDPVFFRPAKAGEIAERFVEYHLFRDGELVDKVKTYRGLGQCFF